MERAIVCRITSDSDLIWSGLGRFVSKGDGNDQVGAHPSHSVDRDVLQHASVNENHIANLDRGEDAGQRHRRAHGDGQGSFREHNGIATYKIRCHTSKRNGQLIEVGDLGVAQG
jgi:hypothetical protein